MANLNRNWQSQVAKINIKNVSGETIPPYACCELDYDVDESATELDGDEIIFRVKKPTADGEANSSRIVFNGAGKIQDEHVGTGVFCPLIQSLWDYTTAPEIGQSCGATSGEWYLSTSGLGFTFKSVDATEAYTDNSVADVKTAFFELSGGGGSIKYAYPPSGGIPASTYNSDTKKMVPGTASCTLAELVDGEYCDTGDEVIVENPVGSVVGSSGKPMTVGETAYGKWTVLVEDCTGDAAPVEPTAMTPDPGESSGSRALDPGYKIGV